MTSSRLQIVTSHDGQHVAVRRGRDVEILANGFLPALARIELETADAEIAMVGPPGALVAVAPGALSVHQLPGLDASARVELDAAAGPWTIAAATGGRVALVAADAKSVVVARTAGRAVTTQTVEPGSALEFAVGLDKHQFLFALHKKLEVWDAASGRPLLRLQLQLPPPPRVVGSAQGHLWVTRPNGSEIFVYRLSDGRPFRHDAGEEIERVICHPASPMVVLVTRTGLVRLHCFAHSLLAIDAPPDARGSELALLAPDPDNVVLLGLAPGSASIEPWRIPLGALAAADMPVPAPVIAAAAAPVFATPPPPMAAAPAVVAPAVVAIATPPAPGPADWREPLVAYGAALVAGTQPVPGGNDAPGFGPQTELGVLAQRLGLGPAARKALVVLYALYLAGEALPIARVAKLCDWSEALGRGELGALHMLAKRGGRARLRRAVTEFLDGCAPRAVRVVAGTSGGGIAMSGAHRLARDGRTDAELEVLLAAELGRIAIATGTDGADLDRALLEARLHGCMAVALAVPAARPTRWPRGAGLVLVLYGSPASWVADLPTLPLDASTAS